MQLQPRLVASSRKSTTSKSAQRLSARRRACQHEVASGDQPLSTADAFGIEREPAASSAAMRAGPKRSVGHGGVGRRNDNRQRVLVDARNGDRQVFRHLAGDDFDADRPLPMTGRRGSRRAAAPSRRAPVESRLRARHSSGRHSADLEAAIVIGDVGLHDGATGCRGTAPPMPDVQPATTGCPAPSTTRPRAVAAGVTTEIHIRRC